VTALRVIWTFLVDLIVGDDPKIAVAVVTVLVAVGALFVAGVLSAAAVPVIGAVLLVAAFTVSLLFEAR
jgi:hypothetical protein